MLHGEVFQYFDPVVEVCKLIRCLLTLLATEVRTFFLERPESQTW